MNLHDDIHDLKEGLKFLPAKDQSFASSLIAQFEKKGSLSEKQAHWACKLANEAQKPSLPGLSTTAMPTVKVGDFSGVINLFNLAKQHLQFPKIKLQLDDGSPIALSMAGSGSKYPGTINVTNGGPYGQNIWYGRVTKEGVWEQSSKALGASMMLTILLLDLAKDPAGTAAAYGKLVGRCCFCQLPLSDVRSTEVGYGKVCAEHYHLPWGKKH